jgi:hypothetical protein
VEIKNGQSRESGNFWVHKAHDEGNQNKKNTTQHVLDTIMRQQTQIA